MTGSDLAGAILLGTEIDGGDWSYVSFRGVDLSAATLAGRGCATPTSATRTSPTST